MTRVLLSTPVEESARAIRPPVPPGSRRVHAFVGAKGGVGASTLAVNVAAALGRSAPTLLVDVHPDTGDLDAFFDTRARYSLADACASVSPLDADFPEGMATTVAPGLDLLPARHREPTPVQHQALRAVVAAAARIYAHVVLDVAPPFHPLLDRAVVTETIVLVGNQEMLALRRADRLLRGLRGPGDAQVLFVLNRLDEGERPVEEIERLLAVPIAQTFPDAYRLVIDALHRGCPLDGRARHPLVDAIDAFAARLSGRDIAPPRSRSWLAGAWPLRRPAAS